MGTPYLGEIRLLSFSFAPKGWIPCDGQVLPAAQYRDLYSVLGNTFGGTAGRDFGIPDLRGRVATHRGTTLQGAKGGARDHLLTLAQLATHQHTAVASNTQAPATDGNVPTPQKRLAGTQPGSLYGPTNNVTPMSDDALTTYGGGSPHENRQPYTTVMFAIAMLGIMPERP
jgi:microcystin-dependent protein